jgi:hypothetical protein
MRQLVVLCDGTNNNLTGSAKDTHVVALAELLRADPDDERVVFYDPGVGNPGTVPGTTAWDKLRRGIERIDGLAFGRGVFDNIAEGYRFLMRQWRSDEDQIWVFGFSRGAFTARSIGGMVNLFGLLPPHMTSMVPTLVKLYFSDPTDRTRSIAEQATRLFAEAPPRRPFIHFVGVWDTVATVGTWPFSLRMKAKPTLEHKRFVNVRQALALDEHRAQFVPRAYAQDNGSFKLVDGSVGTIVQQWFRGAHCDVGGGYGPSQSQLAGAPLAWLVSEAVRCGLRLHDGGRLLANEADAAAAAAQVIERHPPKPPPGPVEPKRVHCQLHETPLWALSGMELRDSRIAAVDGTGGLPVATAEHPSVAAWDAQFPQDSVWRSAGLSAWWWGFLVVGIAAYFAVGQLLFGDGGGLLDYARANLLFQLWQVSALFHNDGAWWYALTFDAPRWGLAWDLLLIASYAYVLATLAARAFAHAARFNRLGMPAPKALNWLGRALPVMVIADVLENLFSWLAITLGHHELWLLAALCRVVMTLAVLAKYAGLAGVLALIFGWRALRPRQPAPGATPKLA